MSDPVQPQVPDTPVPETNNRRKMVVDRKAPVPKKTGKKPVLKSRKIKRPRVYNTKLTRSEIGALGGAVTGKMSKIVLTSRQKKKLIEGAKGGLNQGQIATKLGISESTLGRILKRDPAILTAYKTAALIPDEQVIGAGFKMATSGKSPMMTMFWLTSRCGFKKMSSIEITSPNDSDKSERVDLSKLNDKELVQLRVLMTKAKPEDQQKEDQGEERQINEREENWK